MRPIILATLAALVACNPPAPTPGPVVKSNPTNVTPPVVDDEESVNPQDKQDYAKRDKTKDGKITGTVKFTGAAPDLPRLPINEAVCKEKHGGKEMPKDESIIVNDNKTLRNVFVYIKKGDVKNWAFETPTAPNEINQDGCMYKPHVSGMMVNQPLKVKNSDPLLHNIHAVPSSNAEFNFGQANVGEDTLTTTASDKGKTFTLPEVMVRIKCDVHGWMGAYVGVLKNPFFAVTNDKGEFTLEGVPPGDYEVYAWHEFYGNPNAKPKGTAELQMKVKVEAGKAAAFDFEFKG